MERLENYDGVGWKDYPDKTTTTSARNFGKMDKGIQDNRNAINEVIDEVTDLDEDVEALNNTLTGMKALDELGTLSVSAINTWQSKTVTSIANYRFLYMEWLTSTSAILQTVFIPMTVFRTHNTEGKRVIFKYSDERLAEIHYKSDTSINIAQTNVNDTIKVYGIG